MLLTVTQEDIDRANRARSKDENSLHPDTYCPMAQALSRWFPNRSISVGPEIISLGGIPWAKVSVNAAALADAWEDNDAYPCSIVIHPLSVKEPNFAPHPWQYR